MYPDPDQSRLQQESGTLTVSRKVVKRLIHRVVMSTPGVIQLGGDSLLKRLLKRFHVSTGPRGIELELADGEAAMTLTLVIRTGVRLPELASELRRRLKKALKEQLGIDVLTVNVHVRSIKGGIGPGEELERPRILPAPDASFLPDPDDRPHRRFEVD